MFNYAKLYIEIYKLNNQIQELENKSNIDINLIEEVLSFTKNIYKTYKEAPKFSIHSTLQLRHIPL